MGITRHVIPIAGLIGTIVFAMYMTAQLRAQTTPEWDFTNAGTAEVHDANGQVVLRGQFAAAEQDDDDVERKAALKAVGTDTDALGEAEVEFAQNAPVKQEVEFSVRNLQAGTVVSFLIDGQVVGQKTVNRRGRAELDIDVRMPGAPPSR